MADVGYVPELVLHAWEGVFEEQLHPCVDEFVAFVSGGYEVATSVLEGEEGDVFADVLVFVLRDLLEVQLNVFGCFFC